MCFVSTFLVTYFPRELTGFFKFSHTLSNTALSAVPNNLKISIILAYDKRNRLSPEDDFGTGFIKYILFSDLASHPAELLGWEEVV